MATILDDGSARYGRLADMGRVATMAFYEKIVEPEPAKPQRQPRVDRGRARGKRQASQPSEGNARKKPRKSPNTEAQAEDKGKTPEAETQTTDGGEPEAEHNERSTAVAAEAQRVSAHPHPTTDAPHSDNSAQASPPSKQAKSDEAENDALPAKEVTESEAEANTPHKDAAAGSTQ